LQVELFVRQDLPKSLPVVLLVFFAIMGGPRATRRDMHELEETGLVGL
jgi:hypothetical protein